MNSKPLFFASGCLLAALGAWAWLSHREEAERAAVAVRAQQCFDSHDSHCLFSLVDPVEAKQLGLTPGALKAALDIAHMRLLAGQDKSSGFQFQRFSETTVASQEYRSSLGHRRSVAWNVTTRNGKAVLQDLLPCLVVVPGLELGTRTHPGLHGLQKVQRIHLLMSEARSHLEPLGAASYRMDRDGRRAQTWVEVLSRYEASLAKAGLPLLAKAAAPAGAASRGGASAGP